MTLPSTYADRNCSLARTLEVIGERWTLLIVRDAFYGIRRFGDFAAQLGIPRAVLTSRLKSLVQEGVLTRDADPAGTVEYRLTAKGTALWPAVRALMNWGDTFYSPAGERRVQRHDLDGGVLDRDGRCPVCSQVVPVPEIRIEPGPGFDAAVAGRDPLSLAVNTPRRLLEPITAPPAAPAAAGEPGTTGTAAAPGTAPGRAAERVS
jgi:DNA-binding HxlR family transcriptional regulator